LAPRVDPFEAHREDARAARITRIQNALDVLSSATFENVTNLAVGVAKIVAEIELRVYLTLPTDKQVKKFKPISHVTLLRNDKYRGLLEQHLSLSIESSVPVSVSSSDFEALKIRNASLAGHIEQLKLTIRNLDSGIDPALSMDGEKLRQDNDYLAEELKFVIRMLDDVLSGAGGMFITKMPGEEDRDFKVAGLHGPMDLVATYDDLLRLEALRKKLHF